MGISNSKKLLELVTAKKEQDAIHLLSNAYLLDPNYTNINGDTVLHLACSNNLCKFTEKLLSFDPDLNKLNKFQSAPLHIATRMGHIQIIRLLLKKRNDKYNKLDINSEAYSNINSLSISASCNNLPITRLLIEHGAHIQDITLLYSAMHCNGDELCRILLGHGGDVNATDKYGNTALMQAAAKCNEKVVKVLVSREWIPSIQINKQNQFGWSALHFAYSTIPNNNKEISKAHIIDILLKKGASLQLINDKGQKPKDATSQKYDIDGNENIQSNHEPARKKRKLNNNKEKINLTKEFNVLPSNKNKEDDEEEEEEDIDDPYDNYESPKTRQKNRKRGRQKVNININNNANLRRSTRNRLK